MQHERERTGVEFEFEVVVQVLRRTRAFQCLRVKGAADVIARGDGIEFDQLIEPCQLQTRQFGDFRQGVDF